MSPSPEVKRLLQRLTQALTFYLVSGRVKAEMAAWFADISALGVAAEHGYVRKAPGAKGFEVQHPGMEFAWKELVKPIMAMYAAATDGSYVQEKGCGVTWAYGAADPDFGRWQARRHRCCCCRLLRGALLRSGYASLAGASLQLCRFAGRCSADAAPCGAQLRL